MNKTIFFIVILIAVGIGAYFLGRGNNSSPVVSSSNQVAVTEEQKIVEIKETEIDTQIINHQMQYKIIKQGDFSFQSPKDWQESHMALSPNCNYTSISNPNGDGHRMSGEVSIQKIECFNESNSSGYQEKAEKDGYVILSYYGEDVGTTKEEIALTKQIFKTVVDTFEAN